MTRSHAAYPVSVRNLIVILGLLLAACSTPAAPTLEPVSPPSFDLAHVKATWTEDCATSHDMTDEAFCADVRLAGMTGDGTILYVPTSLAADARDRATEICHLFAFAHFDAAAKDFGYVDIGILDATGGNLAACSIT